MSTAGLNHSGRARRPAAASRRPAVEIAEPTDFGITTRVELISPEIARGYLERNGMNRPLRMNKVDAYSRDMRAGRWKGTHQGIAFYEDGDVADGQHRLHAIIKAGVTVGMLVTRGLRKDAGAAIDTGAVRHERYLARFCGLDFDITHRHVAIARCMHREGGRGSSHTSTQESLAFLQTHIKAIDFVVGLVKSGPFVNSPVSSVIASASYTLDEATLTRFAEVGLTGVCNGPADAGAVLLVRFASTPGITHGREGRRSLVLKSHFALKAFASGKPITKLYEAKEIVYRVPASGINFDDRED